jgi:hypothetical protein
MIQVKTALWNASNPHLPVVASGGTFRAGVASAGGDVAGIGGRPLSSRRFI